MFNLVAVLLNRILIKDMSSANEKKKKQKQNDKKINKQKPRQTIILVQIQVFKKKSPSN